MIPLTLKEKSVLEFIEITMAETGVSPSFQEIGDHFGFASLNSVQNYIRQLRDKGYLKVPTNQKRALQVLHSSHTVQHQVSELSKQSLLRKSAQIQQSSSSSAKNKKKFPETPHDQLLHASREEVLSLPILGKVAAGSPIEAFTHDEFIDVPPSLVRNSDKTYALKVKGSSMIDDGIFDGDIILVQKQSNSANGEIVVASVDSESTVKRIFVKDQKVELRPSNSTMKSMWYGVDQVDIQGVVVGLLRKF